MGIATVRSARSWLARLLPELTHNALSLLGFAIAAASAVVFLTTLVVDVGSARGNPYIGIVAYVVVPSFFVLGIVLVPVGVLLKHLRRRHSPFEWAREFPVLDLNLPRHRTLILGFAVATVGVVSLLGLATVRVTAYMDTPGFCGSCHGVMAPEATAYQGSPHSKVACVDCHIGPGTDWYVRSKLSGVSQVVAYTLNTYPRPIPAPIHELRPARETCEQCHWPEKFFGDKVVVRPRFALDEANSGTMTTLIMRTGGGPATGSSAGGIHWHMNTRNVVSYVAADQQRQKISWIEVTDPSGTKTVYEDTSAPLPSATLATAEKRLMDCMDCHNRPTHQFLSPNTALDRLIDEGTIDRSIPYIKREGVYALSQPYATTAEAVKSIADGLDQFYRTDYPAVYSAKRGSINQAIEQVQQAYRDNFFPETKVDWRTYPDNIGHQEQGAGCLRCHDGKHASATGKVIPFACDTCHSLPSTSPLNSTSPAAGRLLNLSLVPVPTATPQPAPTSAPSTAGQPTPTPTLRPSPTLPPATPTSAAPAAQATPTAAAAAATTPTAAAGVPKAIPHTLAGRDSCLTCHSAGNLAVPASHAGRTDSTCQSCHKPS